MALIFLMFVLVAPLSCGAVFFIVEMVKAFGSMPLGEWIVRTVPLSLGGIACVIASIFLGAAMVLGVLDRVLRAIERVSDIEETT